MALNEAPEARSGRSLTTGFKLVLAAGSGHRERDVSEAPRADDVVWCRSYVSRSGAPEKESVARRRDRVSHHDAGVTGQPPFRR